MLQYKLQHPLILKQTLLFKETLRSIKRMNEQYAHKRNLFLN